MTEYYFIEYDPSITNYPANGSEVYKQFDVIYNAYNSIYDKIYRDWMYSNNCEVGFLYNKLSEDEVFILKLKGYKISVQENASLDML